MNVPSVRLHDVREVVRLAVAWVAERDGEGDGEGIVLDFYPDSDLAGTVDMGSPQPQRQDPPPPPALANLVAVVAPLLASSPAAASSAHPHAVTHHLLPSILPELLPLGPHLSPRSATAVIQAFERLHLLLPLVPEWEANIRALSEAFFAVPTVRTHCRQQSQTSPHPHPYAASVTPTSTATPPAWTSATTPTTTTGTDSPDPSPSPRVLAARLLLRTTFQALLDLPTYLARLLDIVLPSVLTTLAAEEDREVWQLELEFLRECVVLLVGEEEEEREEDVGDKGKGREVLVNGDGEDEQEEDEDEDTPTTVPRKAKPPLTEEEVAQAAEEQARTQAENEAAQQAEADRRMRIAAVRQCLLEVGACTCPDLLSSSALSSSAQEQNTQAETPETPARSKRDPSPRRPFMGLISGVLGSRDRDRDNRQGSESGSATPTSASASASAARSPFTSALPSPARGVLGSAGAAFLGGFSTPASPVVPSTPAFGGDSPSMSLSPTAPPQPQPPAAPNNVSPLTGPTSHAAHAEYCKSVSAVLALISLFTSLAFSPPHTLHFKTRNARAPASPHSIEVFRDILELLLSRTTCQRARLTALQWLMRLRADRDHRLFVMKDVEAEVVPFAALIGRTEESRRALDAAAEAENVAVVVPPTPEMMAVDDRAFSRNRSGSIRQKPSEGRHSRSVSVERKRGSRSRSRQPGTDRRQPHEAPPPSQPIWIVPEELPFVLELGTRPSEGMTTYEQGFVEREEDADEPTPPELSPARYWLPTSVYLSTLTSLLRTETDWELVSYILVHLPSQIANKHLFCGPKVKLVIPELVAIVTQSTKGSSLMDRVGEQKGLKTTDIHGLIYNLVAVLIGYKDRLDRQEQDMIVDTLQEGLTRESATARPCLQALAIACFELPSSMTRSLSKILPKLTQIMSASATSVHIIELICVIGSAPSLYSNFTKEDYQRVFGVAVQYIQYHNSAHATETGLSYSLSQHILQLAYYSIYVWYLSIPLLERPKHIPYIARGLQLATQNKGGMDEPTEVCFDWLARYTWANADPKPHKSFLAEIVMMPSNEKGAQIEEKSYLQGHSIITIRTLMKRGWSEVTSHRPSGTTQIICKLENLPTTGPGEFAPDTFTNQALVMADRDTSVVGKSLPSEPVTLDDGTVIYRHTEDQTARAEQEAHDLFRWTPRGNDGGMRPLDAMTGYVWVGSAPSQRRKAVSLHPSFLPLVVGPFPAVPTPSQAFVPLPASDVLSRTLRMMNTTAVIDVHKIGVLYVAPGQTTEVEILGNQTGSPGYTSFLVHLGRLIRLKGQRDVYSGGLDLENDLDGEYAYAFWDDIAQVIYHTATLMPNYPHDQQHTFKKRHIGNDNIRVVWNDSGLPYKFDTLRTEFQFVNIVIEPHSAGTVVAYSGGSHEEEYYKLTMQRAPGMPEFGPMGVLKIVAARNLPRVVRQISLLADFFASIWTFTAGDKRRDEYVTSWRGRLQAIKRLQAHIQSVQEKATQENDAAGVAPPAEMDFSLAY